MLNGDSVLILSGFLFCLGFLGISRQPNLIKAFISIEIMMFAGIVNFAYFSGDEAIRSGHFAILVAVVLGGLVLAIIFAILTIQLKNGESTDMLSEDDNKGYH